MSETTDLLSEFSIETQAGETPVFVDIPPARFLAIEGMGEPGGEVYRRRLGYLVSVEQRLRSRLKGSGDSFPGAVLEVFFWGVRGPGDFFEEPRSDWNWRLAFRIPEGVRSEDVADVKAELVSEGQESEIAKVRICDVQEGRCVQVLHIGPVDEVRRSVEKIGDFAREHQLSFHGLHHEIYLGDLRRSPSEGMRTIVRMPVC